MADNISFHNPVDAGFFDISTDQVGKVVTFTSLSGVFSANASITIYTYNKPIIKDYKIGSGLTLTGTNTEGNSKYITLIIDGSDFTTYKGWKLDGKCSFFNDGDIEVTFKLGVV